VCRELLKKSNSSWLPDTLRLGENSVQIDMPLEKYDVVVVGGGLVGASFACALAASLTGESRSILVIEAAPLGDGTATQPSFDARSTALSYGSRKFFESMGLWQELQKSATPILDIEISDRGHLGGAHLSHAEQGVDALGYVVENRSIGALLSDQLRTNQNIQLLAPARVEAVTPLQEGMQLRVSDDAATNEINADLVVLADGGRSPVCKQLGIARTSEAYAQEAIIANISLDRPHRNIAFERFTDSGPLAVLPLADLDGQSRCSLVWTLRSEQAASYMAMGETELIALLQECLGRRAGRITHIGERFSYPLSLSRTREQIRPGLALLGNVAHTLHPVAGQGLNLALRDAAALVAVLQKAFAAGDAPGQLKVLQQYIELQNLDQERTILFTDQLVKLFSSNSVLKSLIRKFGLMAIDLLPGMRREFSAHAMGLGRISSG